MADDTSTNQIVLDYTSRDFDAIRAMMVGIGQGVFPEWVTLGEPGDFGTLLIELFAHTSDVLNFYIDRVGSEAFLGTAQLRRSVLYIADQFGYTPIGQQAATAILRVSLGKDEAIFTIPAGTQVSTSGEIQATFETDMDLTIFPGQADIPLLATEGVSVTGASLGLSKGIPNAEFVLPDKGVIYRTVGIQTLEAGQLVDWSYIENVVLARPTQSAFSTYVDDEGFTHVIFGDNAAGRIPPTNVEIRASYRFGIGAKANEIPPGEINTLEPSALTGSIPATLSVSNYDHPLGGADPESVETMRFSIPRTSNTQHRAVTLNDYVSLTMQVPDIGKAIAYGEVYSSVNVRIANNSGILLPDGDSDLTDGLTEMGRLRALVSASLEDKKLLGSHVFVEDVWQKDNQGWEDIVISLDVHVLAGFNRAQTVDRVRTAVLALVDFNAVDFGQRISIGQVYRAATGVEGVDYVVLTEMHGNTVEANASGLVSDVHTPRKKIPRLRPEILDGNLITQEQGLSVTGYGGLVT